MTVTVTEIDPEAGTDTGTFQYVVVYDPSAGFVTGGGWIAYDAAACTVCGNLAGRADFGFVAKYQRAPPCRPATRASSSTPARSSS